MTDYKAQFCTCQKLVKLKPKVPTFKLHMIYQGQFSYNNAMDNLGDILGKKQFDEPPEIKIIKKYVADNFKSTVSITVKPKTIIISASNAALAGTLRMHIHELSELCKTDKRLAIRIGQ
jgi:hypothetical protein